MEIPVYLPPATADDLGNVSGWLIRCKPENDCASLLSMDDKLHMIGSLDEAMQGLQRHVQGRDSHVVYDDGTDHGRLELGLEACPYADHAIVAVCSGVS